MANGNGSLANSWSRFDEQTKLDLAISELDKLHAKAETLARQSTTEHSQIRQEVTNTLAAIKSDFHERITQLRTDMEHHVDDLRKEMREGFEKMEKRQSRSTGLMYTIIGGVIVGLVLAVVNLAPH